MRALPLLLIVACDNDLPTYIPKDSEADTDDTWVGDTGTYDTQDLDGDLDDDGFTPEEGDCDDNDIYVSPAREEDEDDGKDNDCDGRIDEEWAGVTVVYVPDAGGSTFYQLDTLGRVEGTVDSDATVVDFDPVGDGTWLAMNAYTDVGVVGADGSYTLYGDFSDTEAYEYGVWAVAVGLDGTFYASTIDRLVSVSPDGTITEVASWVVDFEVSANHQLAVSGLAVDPKTGTLGLYDYFGGFATWSPTEGLDIVKVGNWETSELSTFTGAHADDGNWYTVGVGTSGYAIYQWAETDWLLVEEWADTDWTPYMLTPGDDDDFYISANGGWFPTVWRVTMDTGYAADFYVTDGSEPSSFYTIKSRW